MGGFGARRTGGRAGPYLSRAVKQDGVPYSGTVDLEFSLWDAGVGGNQIGSTVQADNVDVVSGLFTVSLNFGAEAFNGDARWLQVVVNGVALSPRHILSATPYATFASGNWGLSGNWNTGAAFLGSKDNAPVELRVNNRRAARYIYVQGEPPSDLRSVNVLAGSPVNEVGPNAIGATVAGGGRTNEAGVNFPNRALGNASTVSGGSSNTASGTESTVSGGVFNTASGFQATVPGGSGNIAAGSFSFAAGLGANANHLGTFVWSDGSVVPVATTGNNQFLIRATGGVGINTDTPGGATLTVAGGVRARGGPPGAFGLSNNGFAFTSNGGDEDSGMFGLENGLLSLFTNSAERIRIDGQGNVSIGAGDALGFLLAVNGDAAKPGGGGWTEYSDARLKTGVRPMTGTLDRLLSLRGYEFEYTPEAVRTRFGRPGRQFGLLAQEVQRVFPDWVGRDEAGYLHVTERATTALMVEALRELRAEKDAEIAALRARVEHLERMMDQGR